MGAARVIGSRWAPAVVLLLGLAAASGGGAQRRVPLEGPLAASLPRTLDGFTSRDVRLSAEEVRVAGMTDYLMRVYAAPAGGSFSVYVGYYASQLMGQTIHSPKNCLPGAGWQPIVQRRARLVAGGRETEVNEYLIQNGASQALVLYWYQGRGRVEASEYRVKWDLLRDAVRDGRTDEALVRIIVPLDGSEAAARRTAVAVAADLIPSLDRVLPGKV